LNKEFVRFIIVGIINTIFYYALFSSLIYLNLDYKLAVLIATIIGVFFSFFNFGKYVFKNQNKKLIIRFIFNYILIYFFNIYIIGVMNNMLFFNFYIAGFVALFPSAILTYMLNKYFVFNKKREDEL